MIEQLSAAERNEEVMFLRVDVDQVRPLAQKLKVNSMPTFVFFKNSHQVASLVGANESKLRTLLYQHK